MLEAFWEFISLTQPNVRYVLFGFLLISASAAVTGSFLYFRKSVLIGDAIAHALLPGICLGFMVSNSKNPLLLIIGAVLTGWVAILTVNWIVKQTKLQEDSAIAIALSIYFAIGVVLLTHIQQQEYATQSGIENFLFGKAASLTLQDVISFSALSLLILGLIFLFFKELTLTSFDPQFARTIGFPVKGMDFLLSILTVLAIVAGIQAIGVVLMAAMLITPTATARMWSSKLVPVMLIALGISSVATFLATFISYTQPNMPTGPWTVIFLAVITLASVIFAPGRGLLAKRKRKIKIHSKILRENILKTFYHIGERRRAFFNPVTVNDIQAVRLYPGRRLRKALHTLRELGYVEQTQEGWILTTEGKEKGQRITRLHRLWELYLTQHLKLAPDHVHDDAETMEHIITPEIEKQLEEKLSFPRYDPHHSLIPPGR